MWVSLKCDICGGETGAKYNSDKISRGQLQSVSCQVCAHNSSVCNGCKELQREIDTLRKTYIRTLIMLCLSYGDKLEISTKAQLRYNGQMVLQKQDLIDGRIIYTIHGKEKG